ncbi:hypothetical protein TNCV_4556491 [Trichonephila clavipes]|nr:hypothetical protein TNCV_4556491 [Trichonephila clavipes]
MQSNGQSKIGRAFNFNHSVISRLWNHYQNEHTVSYKNLVAEVLALQPTARTVIWVPTDPDAMFMDGHALHRAHVANKYMERENFLQVEWAAHSPDLN